MAATSWRARVGAWVGGFGIPGGFDATSGQRRLRGFVTSRVHVNALIAASGPEMNARARWLVRNKRGFGHQEWQKMRERNEALDCRVYARAAAWIHGADRWDESTWRSLENQAGVVTKEPVVVVPPEQTAPTAGTVLTPRRRRPGAVIPTYMR